MSARSRGGRRHLEGACEALVECLVLVHHVRDVVAHWEAVHQRQRTPRIHTEFCVNAHAICDKGQARDLAECVKHAAQHANDVPLLHRGHGDKLVPRGTECPCLNEACICDVQRNCRVNAMGELHT